jgi:hypothetical protein
MARLDLAIRAATLHILKVSSEAAAEWHGSPGQAG